MLSTMKGKHPKQTKFEWQFITIMANLFSSVTASNQVLHDFLKTKNIYFIKAAIKCKHIKRTSVIHSKQHKHSCLNMYVMKIITFLTDKPPELMYLLCLLQYKG